MTISFVETSEGFSVTVPYRMKDYFKQIFPSAKWNPSSKTWTVGKRAKNKLEQFNDNFQKQMTEIAEQDEILENTLMTKNEIEEMQYRIDAELKNIKELIRQNASLKEINELLDSKKSELEDLKKQVAEEEDTKKNELSKLSDKVFSIISLEKIEKAWSEMKYQSKQIRKENKSKFYDAQKIISEQNELLAEIGISSKILSIASELNWNRSHGSDKDSPYNHILTKETILSSIKAIQKGMAPQG